MTEKAYLFAGWIRRCVVLLTVATLMVTVWGRPASAEDDIKISAFQGSSFFLRHNEHRPSMKT